MQKLFGTVTIFLLLITIINGAKISPIGPPISHLKDSLSFTTPTTLNPQPQPSIQFYLYVDLACSDSAAWWTTTFKQLDSYYFTNSSTSSSIRMNLHLLPLPYHISSYATSMTYIVINKFTQYNYKILKQLVNAFYTNQSSLFNNVVAELKQSDMVRLIYVNYVKPLGVIEWNEYQQLMNDGSIDMRTRTLFKLSTASGVFATPSFYVNGVAVQNGEDFAFSDWVALFNSIA